MVTREEIQGHWHQLKGRLKENWGQLTDDDLSRAKGSAEQLVGVVQQRTGAARSEVEKFVDEIVHQGGSTIDKMTTAASTYAESASAVAQDHYERATDATQRFSREVVRTVKERPAESLAIAFGLGIAAGAVFFLGRRNG